MECVLVKTWVVVSNQLDLVNEISAESIKLTDARDDVLVGSILAFPASILEGKVCIDTIDLFVEREEIVTDSHLCVLPAIH
jgi:hypothetical protein